MWPAENCDHCSKYSHIRQLVELYINMRWLYKNKEISYSVCSEVADFDMSLDLQCTNVAVLYFAANPTRTDNFIAVYSMLTLLSLELACCDSIITRFCHWLLKLCSFYSTHTDTHSCIHHQIKCIYIFHTHAHITKINITFIVQVYQNRLKQKLFSHFCLSISDSKSKQSSQQW